MAPRSKIAVPDVRGMRNLLSPEDTFVETKPQYTSEAYDDKSKALGDLKRALGVVQTENEKREKIWQKKKDKADKAAATKAAILASLDGTNIDSQSGETLYPKQSPLFWNIYDEKLGNMHATQWQTSLLAKYEKEKGGIENIPSWLAEQTQTYLNSLGDNPSYISGAYPIISQASSNLISSHASYTRKSNQNKMEVALLDVWGNNYKNPNLSTTDAVLKNWDDLQLAVVYGTTGKDRLQLRNEFFAHAIGHAKSSDPGIGIGILNALKQIGVNKQYVLKEKTPDGIRSTPTGLSALELSNIESAIDGLEQEEKRQEQDDRDRRTNLITDNTEKAVSEFAKYRYELGSKIPTLKDKRDWIQKYMGDNKLDENSFNIGKWEATVDARISNDRITVENQAKLPPISASGRAIQTSEATGYALVEFNKSGSNSRGDVEAVIGKVMLKYPHANDAVIRAALIRATSKDSIYTHINKFKESTNKLFKIFGHDDLTGQSTALGQSIAASFHTHIVELEKKIAQNPGETEIKYGGVSYHIDQKSGILKLRDAVLKSVLEEAKEDSTQLQTILKGPNAPENKDDWNVADIINKVSKKSIYNVLTTYGVGTAVEEEKEVAPPADLSDAANVIYQRKLKEQIAKNDGKPLMDAAKQMLATAAAKEAAEAPANMKQNTTGDTPSKPSEGALDIDKGINALLEQYGPESEREFKATTGRGTQNQSLTDTQIDNFLRFLVEVDLAGLYKSEDIFEGAHNRRKKTGTKKTKVPLNQETQKELFSRYFDLAAYIPTTEVGFRAAYFDTLWNQVEQRLRDMGKE